LVIFAANPKGIQIHQPRVGPSRTGDPPSSDFGGTSELVHLAGFTIEEIFNLD